MRILKTLSDTLFIHKIQGLVCPKLDDLTNNIMIDLYVRGSSRDKTKFWLLGDEYARRNDSDRFRNIILNYTDSPTVRIMRQIYCKDCVGKEDLVKEQES